jgi:hypothetical protein
MLNSFFPGGQSINAANRIANSHSVPFDWSEVPFVAPSDPAALWEADMSDPAIQRVLRGECPNTPSAVVRIADIPIFRNTAAPGIPIGTPINAPLNASQAELQAALDAIHNLLYPAVNNPPSSYHQLINLTNLDENRRYFVFADLVIHRFVGEDAAVIGGDPDILVLHPETPSVASIFSNIAGDTTVGTPTEPDSGMIDPPAPQNLRAPTCSIARPCSCTIQCPPWPAPMRTQTAASILWSPIFPAQGEQGVRIEWEIIRIRDGERMTDDQMQTRQINLQQFLTEINSLEKFAWQTDTVNGERRLTLLPNATFTESNDRFEFDFEGLESIHFRDNTLSPNRLYFYYVRTVRVVTQTDPQLGTVETRRVSNWVEVPVTTFPVTAPTNLRVEDGEVLRPGIDLQTEILVSWEHEDMARILEAYGTEFAFQYRIREAEGEWMEITTVPAAQMVAANLHPDNANRIFFLLDGLEPGTVYQMQVRLRDITSDDTSLWSNTISFITEFPQEETDLDRDIDDWLEFLHRKLREILLRPFWFAEISPASSILVYRPEDVFNGLMLESPGAIPLHNTDANNIIFYMPASVILAANENRKGFSTRYSDLDILFAPSVFNPDHNQPMMDIIRAINARNSDLTDYFVRIEIQRVPMAELFEIPALTRQTTVSASLIATNDNIRNIRTWERTVLSRATTIVNETISDAVMRQNIRDLLLEGTEPEEMLDYVNFIIARVENEIAAMVSGDLHTGAEGILAADSVRNIEEFNAPMHLVVTTADEETSVNAFRLQNNTWTAQTTVEYNSGRAIMSRTPGTWAFTGRRVIIPGIEEVLRGGAVTSIVARFGLEDLFGANVDLQQFANRRMVIGSMARIAGAPQSADPMAWAAANLNVTITSRNATGLISNQEAIAVVMAAYERRTNTRINSIRITNFQLTAGMTLDNRYAQAVRAAFQVGIVSDTSLDPVGPITIGEFLDILAELHAKLPL